MTESQCKVGQGLRAQSASDEEQIDPVRGEGDLGFMVLFMILEANATLAAAIVH